MREHKGNMKMKGIQKSDNSFLCLLVAIQVRFLHK